MTSPSVQLRRKPRQSRAKQTQQALLDSVVRLLQQQAPAQLTIREITELAGVGLGTFYEYFAQKEDLLAWVIHQQIIQHAEALRSYTQPPLQLSTTGDICSDILTLLRFQLDRIRSEQRLWASVFLLERSLSSEQAYQKHYQLMLDSWQQILSRYTPETRERLRCAENLHRISYGFISQTLLIQPTFQDWPQLQADIELAIQPFLARLISTKSDQNTRKSKL
ncbi:TetR/AcrR family transcriptional regulator [Acinetobacter indicus]|uniref:TetR/AcrR family transcriptional regulator n=1 Tax=Acinetobacter indicus TaxID=756892 RepID=UPI000CEC7401|nr:TetR/AcrR family transcriptional regulator [Acinetobacter indicus]